MLRVLKRIIHIGGRGYSDATTSQDVAEVEVPILWPPNAKSQLIGKDPHGGKNRGQ